MKDSFNSDRQNQLAQQFHALHHSSETLVLSNVWDSTSAKIAEQAGFPAIATTSSGISWSCGYRDGEHIPPDLMIRIIRHISRSVNLPVTADVEGGYYQDSDKFKKFFADLIEAGAVGINLEDSHSGQERLDDLRQQTKKIGFIKSVAREKGVNLFINARTDAIEKGTGNLDAKITTCIERAKAFQEAGADGIFVPFVKEIETVARLKAEIKLPLNILFADTLPVSELKRLKVNRISTGSRPILATLSLLKKIAGELRNTNEWTTLLSGNTIYPEINGLFE